MNELVTTKSTTVELINDCQRNQQHSTKLTDSDSDSDSDSDIDSDIDILNKYAIKIANVFFIK